MRPELVTGCSNTRGDFSEVTASTFGMGVQSLGGAVVASAVAETSPPVDKTTVFAWWVVTLPAKRAGSPLRAWGSHRGGELPSFYLRKLWSG